YVVAVRLAGAVLANALLWSATVFYPYYDVGAARWDISPLRDQSAAGGLMMVEGSLLTIGLFAWLFLRSARESQERQEDVELAALLDRQGLLASADRRGQRPSVLARPVGDRRHVGRDILGIAPGHQLGRHRPAAQRIEDLLLDDAADRAAPEPAAQRRLERLVEVGPDLALGARSAQHVAGAALGDEQPLAVHQVRLAALDLAAADGEQ